MAAAKEPSISLAIGVTPQTGIDAFDLLRPRLLESLVWRQRLPVAGRSAVLDQQELRSAYRELLRQCADELGRIMTGDAMVDELIELQRTCSEK
jgi:hypothetical protein